MREVAASLPLVAHAREMVIFAGIDRVHMLERDTCLRGGVFGEIDATPRAVAKPTKDAIAKGVTVQRFPLRTTSAARLGRARIARAVLLKRNGRDRRWRIKRLACGLLLAIVPLEFIKKIVQLWTLTRLTMQRLVDELS